MRGLIDYGRMMEVVRRRVGVRGEDEMYIRDGSAM